MDLFHQNNTKQYQKTKRKRKTEGKNSKHIEKGGGGGNTNTEKQRTADKVTTIIRLVMYTLYSNWTRRTNFCEFLFSTVKQIENKTWKRNMVSIFRSPNQNQIWHFEQSVISSKFTFSHSSVNSEMKPKRWCAIFNLYYNDKKTEWNMLKQRNCFEKHNK